MNTAESLTTSLAVGRIAFGLAAVVAPAQFGKNWVGGVAERPETHVLTRAFGVRDIALGAASLGALRSTGTGGVGFKVLTALGVLVDAVDALSTVAARDHLPNAPATAAVAGAAAASGAAVLALSDRAER